MFENIQGRFQDIFKRLSGKHRIDENSIREALRDVRLAFLKPM